MFGERKKEYLQRAISLLREAKKHRDVMYSARATYQLSKALYDYWDAYQEQSRLDEAHPVQTI